MSRAAILLVDDEPQNLSFLRRLLEADDYLITEATDGQTGDQEHLPAHTAAQVAKDHIIKPHGVCPLEVAQAFDNVLDEDDQRVAV